MARTLKKFMNGAISVQEYHITHAFPEDARCLCAAKPAVRAIIMVPYDEALKRGMIPEGHEASNDLLGRMLLLKGADGRGEPHFRWSTVYSCRQCQPAFEKELAKAPSWAVVDINRGPDPSNRVTVGAF